jgi:threonine dehydrogenase-like Zn-dependent dehydrogenase
MTFTSHELNSQQPNSYGNPKYSYLTDFHSSETYMQMTGALIHSWPIVLGCDASGIVVEVGEGVSKFKKDDGVFGW